MIAKISRGGRAEGLMAYLVGGGKRNEHENPHLVAGSAGLMTWYGTDVLSKSDAYRLGKHLEAPSERFGTEVTLPVKEADEATGQLVPTDERRAAHIWHCSLSLAPDHPAVDDDTWGDIARDFIDKMEFVVQDADGNDVKAPCRWVAVHHGKSMNGGDHIHIAVNLVREDGTKASTRHDYRRASAAVAQLEEKYGLEVVEGRATGRSVRADPMRELAEVEAGKVAEPRSARLSRIVRACASSSTSEAQFIRQLRREGLWVRPRFAAGGHDQVVGFAVAERPPAGKRAEWRAAGKLGRDLTLPRLQELWPADEASATEAIDEWRSAWRGTGIAHPEAEPVPVPDDQTWRECARELADVNQRIAATPMGTAGWAQVAREASGTLAAWSLRTETVPGELARAADMLARGAAIHRYVHQQRPPKSPVTMRRTAGMLLSASAAARGSVAGQAMIARQLVVTVKSLTMAAERTGQVRQLAKWNAGVQRDLETVAARLASYEATTPAPAVTPPVQRVDPAVPNALDKARQRAMQNRDGRGFER